MLEKIENLTFAELKANRAALVAEAAQQPLQALAARYVQARTDAKMRDERMSAMGLEFTDLGNRLKESAQREAAMAKHIKALMGEIADLNKALERKTDKDRIRELEARVQELAKPKEAEKA